MGDFKASQAKAGKPLESELTQEEINGFYLDFERLFYRVERSNSHYQVLGIDRNSSIEEIKTAYQKAVALLEPFLAGAFHSSSVDTRTRARQILRKVSDAFTVVSNIGKRLEYDNAVFRRAPGRIEIKIPDSFPTRTNRGTTELAPGPARGKSASGFEAIRTRDMVGLDQSVDPSEKLDIGSGEPGLIEVPAPARASSANRRRFERIRLTVIARVTGHDRIRGKWEEIAETMDVSRKGAALRMSARLRHGTILRLEIALPLALRSHGLAEPTYRVYAAVRRIGPLEDGYRVIGVEFVGEEAPPGYFERPWATFKVDSWQGPERRREHRIDRSEVVSIRYLNESMEVIRQEVAVTENVSPGGARVFVKGAPSEVETIRIMNLNHSFESLAAVCDRYIGNDGFERICLKFLDNKWPV